MVRDKKETISLVSACTLPCQCMEFTERWPHVCRRIVSPRHLVPRVSSARTSSCHRLRAAQPQAVGLLTPGPPGPLHSDLHSTQLKLRCREISGRGTSGQAVGRVAGDQYSRQHPRRTRNSWALEGEAQVRGSRKGSGRATWRGGWPERAHKP